MDAKIARLPHKNKLSFGFRVTYFVCEFPATTVDFRTIPESTRCQSNDSKSSWVFCELRTAFSENKLRPIQYQANDGREKDTVQNLNLPIVICVFTDGSILLCCIAVFFRCEASDKSVKSRNKEIKTEHLKAKCQKVDPE